MCWNVQSQVKVFNQNNLILKTIIVAIMIGLAILSLLKGEFIFESRVEQLDSNIGKFVEWSATYTLAAFFYVMSRDVKDFRF